MDLIGISAQMRKLAADHAAKKYGLKRADVMLCSSHTHCGPALDGKLSHMLALTEADWKRIRENQKSMNAKLIRAIDTAFRDLKPARLYTGIGKTGFAVNRRKPIGTGPTDHDVPVLRVTSADGKTLRGVIFGYACHNTVLSFYKWCGDYAGFAQLALEDRHQGAVALFFTGCGADQNPLPRRKVELADKYGRMLAKAVDDVMNGKMESVDGRLRTAFRSIDLSFDTIPPRSQFEQELAKGSRYQKARARLLLAEFDKFGALPKTHPYPVQVWAIGDNVDFVALGGEVVVDYSLRLKKELGAGRVWVAGYANHVMAYIPSERILKEGGLVFDLAFAQYTRELDLGRSVDIAEFVSRFPEVEDPEELKELLETVAVFRAEPDINAMLLGEIDWPQPGDLIFDDFLVERIVGEGSASKVYLAREMSAGKRGVIVKVCVEGCGPGNEADILGPLSHRNIGKVLSVRRDPNRLGQLYGICMPYEGETTLRSVIDDQIAKTIDSGAPISAGHVRRIIRIGERLADALEYTHKKGILHGDVKPSNVLIADDGEPILIDFNLSSRRALDEGATGGTIVYMAPEQFAALLDESSNSPANRPADQASDVFSFGVTLFEALTGLLPFGEARALRAAGSIETDPALKVMMEAYYQQQQQARLAIRDDFPHLPEALADLLQSCLSMNPMRRPSLKHIASKLRRLDGGTQTVTVSKGRRKRIAVLTAVVLALSVVAVIPFLSGLSTPEQQESDSKLAKAIEALQHHEYELADRLFTEAAIDMKPNADVLARHAVAKLGRIELHKTAELEKYDLAHSALKKLEKSIELGFAEPDRLIHHIGHARTVMHQYRRQTLKPPFGYANLTEQEYADKVERVYRSITVAGKYHALDPVDYGCQQWPENTKIRKWAVIYYAAAIRVKHSGDWAIRQRFYEHYWCLVRNNAQLKPIYKYLVKNHCRPIKNERELKILLADPAAEYAEIVDPVQRSSKAAAAAAVPKPRRM
eukprot:g8388.t1